MTSPMNHSNRTISAAHHCIDDVNGGTGSETNELSVRSNAESCLFSTQSSMRTVNSVDESSTINLNDINENDEEDSLTEVIDQLIFEFLSHPNRRQPYKSSFRWTVNPSTMPMYHVTLYIAQHPSEKSWN